MFQFDIYQLICKFLLYVYLSARDYATVIAVSSDRLTNEEMKNFMTGKQMEDLSWIRALPKEAATI